MFIKDLLPDQTWGCATKAIQQTYWRDVMDVIVQQLAVSQFQLEKIRAL